MLLLFYCRKLKGILSNKNQSKRLSLRRITPNTGRLLPDIAGKVILNW